MNPLDWHLMRGTPYLIRMGSGFSKPKSDRRLGAEYAGTIEAVGRAVTQFTVGEAVFGGRDGSIAEYVTVPADRAVRKPARLTFEQTAGVCVAGMTALQALRNKAQVQPGQKILIRLFVATPNRDDLQTLADLIESGRVTPVIDRCYPLSETAEAMRHLESGRARGKVVVTIA